MLGRISLQEARTRSQRAFPRCYTALVNCSATVSRDVPVMFLKKKTKKNFCKTSKVAGGLLGIASR